MKSLKTSPSGDVEIDLRKLSALELITLLDKSHPPRCILLGEAVEAAHRYAGRRELIDELVAMRAEDEDRDTSVE